MIASIALIMWLGSTPVFMGQYHTPGQCWNVVRQLLQHGVGADKEFTFQCIDPGLARIDN